jgi:hypothetical protein
MKIYESLNQHKDGGVYLIGHGHKGDTDYTFEVFYNQKDYNSRMKEIINNLKLYRNEE